MKTLRVGTHKSLVAVAASLITLAISSAQMSAQMVDQPSPVPENCFVEVVIASAGQPISLLFEPALQAAAGEQLVYDTLMGSFVTTSPSLITWVPTCAGWDFVQVRAVDANGNSRVVARVDFMVDDESQLTETYDLTVEVEGRGWIVPLSAGGEQYAAIWLNDYDTQAPGQPGRGGRLCLPRPSPPPGLTCASLPPGGLWVCPPFYDAAVYCTGLSTCEYREGQVVVVLCGEAAARLKAQLGLQHGCIRIGSFEVCVVAGGCVQIISTTRTRVQCQQCVVDKKQYCRRYCCRNGVVECCEQHLWRQRCWYRRLWLPFGVVHTNPDCDPPVGPYTQPGCNW